MKNKEIEELLNMLKKCAREDKATLKLNEIACKTILSYIEQLENNSDKALKIIDSYDLGKYDYSIPAGGIIELREVLKGDSDG